MFYCESHSSFSLSVFAAYPDVEVREITDDWEFLILACDGIWDVLSNDAVIDFCRQRIAMGQWKLHRISLIYLTNDRFRLQASTRKRSASS